MCLLQRIDAPGGGSPSWPGRACDATRRHAMRCHAMRAGAVAVCWPEHRRALGSRLGDLKCTCLCVSAALDPGRHRG